MAEKKTLIFDCFGVVFSRFMFPWLSEHMGPDFKVMEFLDRMDIGEITEHEGLLYVSKFVNRSPEVVRKEIDARIKPNESLIGYIKELKQQGYQIILLTNVNDSVFERLIFPNYPEIRFLFSDIIMSSHIKMIKPHKDIYLYALQKHNLLPSDVVFTDDNKNYVVGAKEIGIDAVLFTNTEQLRVDFKNRGIV